MQDNSSLFILDVSHWFLYAAGFLDFSFHWGILHVPRGGGEFTLHLPSNPQGHQIVPVLPLSNTLNWHRVLLPFCILMLIPGTLSFSPELLWIYIDLKHLKCEHVLVKYYIMCFRISNPNSCHNNLLLKGILLSPFHSWKTKSSVSYKVGESLDSTLGNWIQNPCLFKNIIYIYLLILGSAGFSLLCELVSSCSKRGCSPAVRGLFIAVSSVVKEHGL